MAASNARNTGRHDENRALLDATRLGRWARAHDDGSDAAAEAIRARGEQALDQLLRRNAALVQYWVRRSRWRGVIPDAELHAAGMLGLLRAIEKYDPERGTTLATYAAWWIRQSMDREAHREERHRHEPLEIDGELRRDAVDRRVDVECEAVDAVAGAEAAAALRARLAELPEPERATFTAWLDTGGDLHATAAHLGVSDGTARYRLAGAASRLRHPSRVPLDPEQPTWEAQAACRTCPEWFFPGRGQRPVAAIAVCDTCPVRERCREVGLEDAALVGVWGGLAEQPRRALRRERLAGR